MREPGRYLWATWDDRRPPQQISVWRASNANASCSRLPVVVASVVCMHRVSCPAGPSTLSVLANGLKASDSSLVSSPFAPLGAVRSRSGGPSPSQLRKTQEYKARQQRGEWYSGQEHKTVISETQKIINRFSKRGGDGPQGWNHEKKSRTEELRLVNKLFDATTLPWTAPLAEELNQPGDTGMGVMEDEERNNLPPGVERGSLVQICMCVPFSTVFLQQLTFQCC